MNEFLQKYAHSHTYTYKYNLIYLKRYIFQGLKDINENIFDDK